MAEYTPSDKKVQSSKLFRGLVTGLSLVLTLSAIFRALEIDRMAGLVLYTEQYLSFMLCIALPLLYLAVPAGEGKKRTTKVPWYDVVFAILGFLCGAYMAVRFPVLTELTTMRPMDGMIVAAVVLLLLTEGLRRTTGRVLPILVACFFIYALVGKHIPGILEGRPVSLGKVVYYLGWDSSGVLGLPMNIVTTIVVAFVLFGNVLFKSGGSSFFTDIATALMGRFRGGQAKIAVFASSLFGMISGSTVANIATCGVITIPLMKQGGYPAHQAGAIEAVASTGGQLMPPVMGAAAFLMAMFLQTTYANVAIAAIFPAILYYAALFVAADLEAARQGIVRIEPSRIPPLFPVLKSGWFFALPFASLLFTLFWWNLLPEKSALYSVAVMIVFSLIFGYKGKRIGLRDLFDAVRATGLAVLDIIMIGAAAGMVIGVMYLSGLSFGLTLGLVKAAGGSVAVLLVMSAIVAIILGMGMPTIGVYVLMATLVAPALEEFGIKPMVAHMFLMYYGMMSMITPPVAIGAFAAATLAGADPMKTGYSAMRFGWCAFVVPFIFVLSPSLLMQGSWYIILIDFLTGLAGVYLISVCLVGFLVRRVGPIARILFGASGLALFLPANAFDGALWVSMAGLVVAAAVVGREVMLRHREAAAV